MSNSKHSLAFTKMQGLGNDFVLIDHRTKLFTQDQIPDLAKKICDRRFGVGSDGIILLENGNASSFLMKMYNPDGSESEACGNGTRCFGIYLQHKRLINSLEVEIETKGGKISIEITPDELVTVNMGKAKLNRADIGILGDSNSQFIEQPLDFTHATLKGTAVSMGNPHLVIFVDNAETIPLSTWGAELEHYKIFPQRTNVHFVQVLNKNKVLQRTWERGAGITLACGTGACATTIAGYITGRTNRNIEVNLPGGILEIDYQANESVIMKGPAKIVYEGTWPL